MKKRLQCFAAILVVIALFLTGCAAKNMAYDVPQESSSASDANGAVPEEAGGSLSRSGAAAPLPNKVIYDGSAELEAKDPGQAMRAVEQEIRRLGGYVASSSIQRGEEAGDDWVEMELKIPAEQLEGMEAFLGSLGTVTDYAMQSEDVTNQYYDAQARLENAKTQRDAYLEMLEQAKTVEDALKVQEALDSVQERIEVLEGQLKLWDHQVSLSTLRLTISAPMVLEVGQLRLMSWDELKNGIVNGLTNAATGTVNILGYLLIALTYLIIPAAIAGIVVWIVLASIRRKRKRDGKQPPHNPQP